MNAGVRTTPCAVEISPRRALPSVLCTRNEKAVMPMISRPTRKAVLSARAAEQQAGVAIRIEPVARLYRVGVGATHGVEPGEGGDQHEQGRARQMEIGHQRVNGAERV